MKKALLIGTVVILAGGALTGGIIASEHEREEHEEHEHGSKTSGTGGVGAVGNEMYAKECGSCHFAYQPGLLAAASWNTLMGGLTDHFGENAELPADTLQALTTYLADNAADKKPSKVFRELAGRSAETPLRISELSGFQKEHREIPAKMVKDNPQVQSFSHCARCHTDAAAGSYDEHKVMVPGFGQWAD